MAEITRVPLQPIAKGSLTRLWLGIIVVVLLAAGIAFFTMPKGVVVNEVVSGTGAKPAATDVVFVKYTGKLDNGTVFDQSQDMPLPVPGILPEGVPMLLDGVVPGFREAILKMQKGGKYTVHIPSDLAYGATPPEGAPIPPNADLTFDVELVDFMPREEVEQRFQAMQQMMGQAGPDGAPAPGGAQPGAAPAPAPAP